MMNRWSMVVDTSEGYVSIEVDAENSVEALEKFREKVNSVPFRMSYGNLFDFKEHTLMKLNLPI